MALTAKQRTFVDEYLVDLNATQAAIRAGYNQKTAHSIGHENLSKPEIASAIQTAMDERAERTQITADRVLQEIARIGFSDIRKVLTAGGNLLNPNDWGDDVAASVASIELVQRRGQKNDDGDDEPETVTKIKIWDKNSALEKLGKHLKLFTDKVEHSGGVTVMVNKP